MKTKHKLLILSFLMSFQYASAQSGELLSSFNNAVKTFKEYDITSVDIKEIDGLIPGTTGGILVFNSQRLTFDGANLLFSYKQTPADKYCYANSKYWKPGSYSIAIPIDDTYIEVSQAYNTVLKYFVVKISNKTGITLTSNGTKELISEYSFATTQKLTADKFCNELSSLIMAIKEEQYNGKLGIKSSNPTKKSQVNKSSSNSQNKSTARKKTQEDNNNAQRKAVKNTGNRSTKTIIK